MSATRLTRCTIYLPADAAAALRGSPEGARAALADWAARQGRIDLHAEQLAGEALRAAADCPEDRNRLLALAEGIADLLRQYRAS